MELGFQNDAPRRATYIRIANGDFVRKVQDGDKPDTVRERTTAKGTTVTECVLPTLVCYVKDLKVIEGEYNGNPTKDWQLRVNDGKDDIVITMGYSSSYARYFINAAASVQDWSVPVRLFPWQMENEQKKGKYRQGITIYTPPHGKDQKVAGKYTNEEVPDMVKVRVNGKDVWDSEKQMAFYENVALNEVLPRIKAARGEQFLNELENESHLLPADDTEEDDGLPF